jgi:uncharacterized protein (TIGR02231 family)
MATVSQKTGEDWSNVKLRLSTGQPNLIVYAPDPSPWLMNYQPPVDPAMFLRAPAPPPPPVPSADYRTIRPVEAAGQDDYIAPILETQGTFTTEFEVPARVTLASDGREIAVGLSRQTLKAEQRVLIAPRSGNEAAVVTARAPRPDGVWLPGQVQLQRDGSYVGAQHWDPQAGDRLQFAFGRDPLVRVTVEHRDRKSGEVGFFNGANQRRIADTYVVTSTHRQPVDVLVLEPTPISESDKVTVKTALRPEPDVRDWEHRRGLVGWSRTLKPNETARFDVDYVIDYPKDGVVQGLP